MRTGIQDERELENLIIEANYADVLKCKLN
jgi:hypothetical protein